MSRWRSVWLVAKRELLERGRSRGFLFSVAFTTLLVIGSFVVPSVLFGDKDIKTIGVVQPAPAGLDVALTATADRVDQTISVVPYDDAAAAQAALDEGQVDAVLAVPADLSSAERSISRRNRIRRSPRSHRRRSWHCGSRGS